MPELEITGLETVEESALQKFDPLAAEGITLGMEARDQLVTNDEELVVANKIKKQINTYSKSVKDMRLAITRPIDAITKSLINRERELLEPVVEGKQVLGDNILRYEQEVERKRTGQRDVNDLDIYEGDIIEKSIDGKKYRWVIEWDNAHMAFIPNSRRIKGDKNDGGDAQEIIAPEIWPKIIGDVYRNPELLEQAR